jgi:hypothetical protein
MLLHHEQALQSARRRQHHAGDPLLDHVARDRLEPLRSEDRQELMADDRRVGLDGLGLARPVVLDVAQELGRRVSKRGARADHPNQRPAPSLGKRVCKPRLGGPLRHEPRGRTAPLRPGRADLLLHLAAVRQPVFRVPHRSAAALYAKNVPARYLLHRRPPPENAAEGAILALHRDIFPGPLRVLHEKGPVYRRFGWAIQDSNLGPLPYQRSALTN